MGVLDFLGLGKTPGEGERASARRAAEGNYATLNANIAPFLDFGKSLVGRYGGRSQSALDDYDRFLSQGITDQQRTAYSNQLLGNTDRSFAQGQNDLLAQIRAQGGNSPLDSSVSAGALANLFGQRAGAYGQAGAQADEWARQMQSNNLANRYGALSGAAGQGAQLGLQGTGLQSSAGNAFTGQLSDLAQQATQAKQLQQQQLIQGIGGLASAAAPFFTRAPGMPPGQPGQMPGRTTTPDISGQIPTQANIPWGQAQDPYLDDLSLQGYDGYTPRPLSPIGGGRKLQPPINMANPYNVAALRFPKTGAQKYGLNGY